MSEESFGYPELHEDWTDILKYNSSTGGETLLVCPQCGFEYLHPTYVKTVRGNDVTVVDSEGTHVEKCDNKTRGVQIRIGYACENGHIGEVILQFHKGNTLVSHQTGIMVSTTEWQVIWRT